MGLLGVSDFGPDFSSDRQVVWQQWLFCEGTEEPDIVLSESERRCDFPSRGQQRGFRRGAGFRVETKKKGTRKVA